MKEMECNLNTKEIEKLKFYDRKAGQSPYTYRGKKVIDFQKLVTEYKDYYMLIATRRFRKEMFCSLVSNNVNVKKIMVVYD